MTGLPWEHTDHGGHLHRLGRDGGEVAPPDHFRGAIAPRPRGLEERTGTPAEADCTKIMVGRTGLEPVTDRL
jgi:hypothetical protein